jgi:hypothetical protein
LFELQVDGPPDGDSMNSKPDPHEIAEEAVGQRLGSAPPEDVRQRQKMSVDETVRRLARSSGSQASIPAKTAESVGERVADAYADPGNVAGGNPPKRLARSEPSGTTDPVVGTVRHATQRISHQLEEQPLMAVMGGFILGYMTALLLHSRSYRSLE